MSAVKSCLNSPPAIYERLPKLYVVCGKFILVLLRKVKEAYTSLVSENIGSVKIDNINHINYREKMNEMVNLAVG